MELVSSCIQSYHIYGSCGQQLWGNNCFASERFKMMQTDMPYGGEEGFSFHHWPSVSQFCCMFVQRGGEITATVTGRQQYSHDLVHQNIM